LVELEELGGMADMVVELAGSGLEELVWDLVWGSVWESVWALVLEVLDCRSRRCLRRQ